MNELPFVEPHLERYNDLRREADKQRLIREIRKQNGHQSLAHQALAWINCRFALLKSKLVRQEGNRRAAPVRALTEPSSITPCQ